jgi:YD repeat-containing protein
MHGLYRRAFASLLAFVFIVPCAAVAAAPPQRIPVKEPSRLKLSARPSAEIHATVVPAIARGSGVRLSGPPMLRPSDLDRLNAFAHNGSAGPNRSAGPASELRRASSLPSNPAGSGTGINPWWRYQEQSVPGGGRLMANVGTGNVLLQDDDMLVPHKGLAMAFRRTYNSQSQHDVNASDAPGFYWKPPGMYGNGWSNTFDAHLVRAADGGVWSVFDIDGTRYDFNSPNGPYSYDPVPGNHTTLAWDGACGYLWTKKSGTAYYFYRPNPSGSCPAMTPEGGYAGRLYQIVGRNRNTSISFTYAWDNGDASSTGKISQITATTESGMTATLSFADVNGHRLLQQLTFPDLATAVTYGYDGNGNLTSVSLPPNNTPGVRPQKSYGYAALGTGWVLSWAASPRFNAGCSSACGSDGGWLSFAYAGSSVPTGTLSAIGHIAVVDPAVPDGTGAGAVQPGYSTTAYQYLSEYYTTGVGTPTYRDTDGHMTNWVVDGAGRPTQTQECPRSANQGQQCTGTLLIANENWDANDNLIAEVDPRGYETDYAYDANGNAVAVAGPPTSTSQGTFRPTKLYDYDAFNNVVAYCDEDETHRAGADWVTPPAASDTLCSSTPASVAHWHAALTYPSYQPFGQLASMTTPLGYVRRFAYGAANQGGVDFGLPTSVSGDPIVQRNGSSITPAQTFWYDGTGNLRCYSKGNGTYVLAYDALGRLTSVADPDDASANAGSVCGKTSGQPGWNTQMLTWYFPDGSKRTTQTPSERQYNVGTYYTYDLDGNVATEAAHHGCVPNQTCADGVTQKWYDGADRLVEVALPHDASDGYSTPWLTRYAYDISGGSSVSFAGTWFAAYGNLFKTQEYVLGTNNAPSWVDQRGNAFDALDRAVAKYTFSPSSNTTLRAATSTYDHDMSTLGLLWQTADPLAQTTTFAYDPRGATVSVTFGGDGGVTPNRSYAYDANGRIATRSSVAYGTETLQYDNDGRTIRVVEASGGGVSSPATLSYAYYGDGSRAAISVASTAVTADPLMTYAYRPDGRRSSLAMTYAGITSPFGWTYTDAGRELTQTDPYTGTTVSSSGQSGDPGPIVRARTSTYDAAGRLASLTDASYPNFSSISHDPEGSVLGFNSAFQASTVNAGFAYSMRGDALSENIVAPDLNATGVLWSTRILNGAAIPASAGAGGVVDPINAAILQTSQMILCDPISKTYRTNVDTRSYDVAGRLTNRTMGRYAGDCSNVSPETRVTRFDAENHTIGETRTTSTYDSATMAWGPNGHPIVVNVVINGAPNAGPQTYHYDGDHVLFVSDSQNRLITLNAEQLGSAGWNYSANPAQGSNRLTIWDRDYAGVQISSHDASGYGGWSFGSTTRKVPLAATARLTPQEPLGLPTPAPYPAPGAAMYVHPDGFEGPFGTVHGVRVSNDTGQWTSPDAYAGDVHDPMSQKPYMWNRNNPYEYSDPSGYDPDVVAGMAQELARALLESAKRTPRVAPNVKDRLEAIKTNVDSGNYPRRAGSQGGPGAGRPFSASDRSAVRAPDQRCAACGQMSPQMQADHTIPRSRGGNNTPDNRDPLCPTCNQSKGANTPPEWLKRLFGPLLPPPTSSPPGQGSPKNE